MAMALLVTPGAASVDRPVEFGELVIVRKTPSKKPYWKGDHGWIVISCSRQ